MTTAYDVQRAFAPISVELTPTATALTTSGIFNKADLGTTAFKVLSGQAIPRGKVRRCKIVCVTASVKVAWGVVAVGGTCAIKADGDGSADEGSIFVSSATGGAVEYIDVKDNLDLYLVASAGSTIVNVTVEEAE